MLKEEMLPPIKSILIEVEREDYRAMSIHEPMSSAHEAYAIIFEELEEFWEEVRKKEFVRNPVRMRKELIQVAAMAIRAIYDLDLPLLKDFTNE